MGGVAGPVLFTAGWVVSSLRQAGVSAAGVQLSGLAADDARDPQIMVAGFVVLGALLGRVGCRAWPGERAQVVAWAAASHGGGAAAVAAGVFRRDHMLLTGPGFAGESWAGPARRQRGGMPAWKAAGQPVAATPLLTPGEVDPAAVIDVRQAGEYADGHLPGARNIELGALTSEAASVEERPVVTMCGHGERAATAASVLERAGHTGVAVLAGGPPDWSDATGVTLESNA